MQKHKKLTSAWLGTLALTGILVGCTQQQPTPAAFEPVTSELGDNVISPDDLSTSPVNTNVIFSDTLETEKTEDLWARIREGMALSEHSHPKLDKQIKWYANNQSYIDRVTERGQRYLFHIVNELENNDMPLELALLPVVESAFDPFAYSHSHAAGLWQFIPDTGERFGLDRNWWYDGRRDPVASTEAAIKYLSYLHQYFDGDWLLALAAYNSGEGNVKRAIARNERNGKPTDFWSLNLPKETKAYVPQLLAVSAIIRQPEEYEIKLPALANEPYFDTVSLNDQADLSQIAKMAQIDTSEIYQLNAGYNRWVTQPDGPQQLLLPVGAIDTFNDALTSTPKSEWVPIKEYLVKKGDNLSTIAHQHNVSVRQLKSSNQLDSDFLKIGQRLKIPGTGLDHPIGSLATTYTVKSGDSLWKIARQHKVKITDITRWNNLSTRTPAAGSDFKTESNPGNTPYGGHKKSTLQSSQGRFPIPYSEQIRPQNQSNHKLEQVKSGKLSSAWTTPDPVC